MANIEEQEEIIVTQPESTKIDKMLIFSIFRTFLLTLFGIFAFFSLVIGALAVFNPLRLATVSKDIGLTQVSALMFEKQYNKSGKLTDLYNAIEVNLEAQRNADSARLIKKMMTNENYSAFCEQVNNSAVASTAKSHWVYVANYDAYLSSQLTKSLYFSGKVDDAKTLAVGELAANSNIYSWEFGAYIDCVLSDKNLVDEQKVLAIKEVYEKDYNGKTFNELVEENLNSTGNPDLQTGLTKLQTLYQKIKINSTIASMKDVLGFDSTAEKNQIETLIEKYNQEING